MKRVKALEYSIPEVCDADAAAFIRSLLVGLRLYQWRTFSKNICLGP